MKKVVVRNESGAVVHIGPWDYREQLTEGSQFVTDDAGNVLMGEDKKPLKRKVYLKEIKNPLPPGYYESSAEVVTGPDGGLYAVEAYGEIRRASYPSLADQLDALWKGGTDADAMRERVLAVKALYPKATA